MISVKQIARPKKSALGTGTSSGGVITSSSTVADEAKHASQADKATFAEQAQYAVKAGTADRAGYADIAGDLADGSPVYDKFLRKDIADTAKGKITLEQGLSVGTDDSGSIDAGGNAKLSDVVVERLHDEDSTEAQRTIIGAQGFDLYMGTDGKSHLYVDYLTARTRMFASSVEIRKVSYSGGTTLFSNAGSQICKVSNVYGTDGSVVAYKCFAVADDGTTRTMNWWHIGMMALCQTFNVKAGDGENLSNRYYWRMVVGVGQEILSDGKLYDYVILSNVKTFRGSASVVPVYSRILADESGNALVWGDVMVEVSIDGDMTSLADAFSNQEGKRTDDAGVAISRRTYYGYEPKEDGTEPDAPLPSDVIVQAGDQIQWKKYGNLIKVSTSTEDNATDNAPSIAMYHNMGAQSLGNPYQWKTCTAVISPEEVRFNASLFKFFTDESEDYDPWDEATEEAKTYTDAQITATKDAITLSVAEKQGVKRNLLQGTACRRQEEGWTPMNGGTVDSHPCEGIETNAGIGGVNALHARSRYNSDSDYINAGFRWVGAGGTQGNIKVEKGKKYTLSVWAKSPTPDYMNVVFETVWQGSATDNTRPAGYAGPTGFSTSYTPTGEWALYRNTVEIPSDAAYEWLEVCVFMKAKDSTVRDGYLCKPMMEEGDTYNGWTPAERDYDYIGGNLLDNTDTLAVGGSLSDVADVTEKGYENAHAVVSADCTASTDYRELLVWSDENSGIGIADNRDFVLSFLAKGSGNVTCFLWNKSDNSSSVFAENSEGAVSEDTVDGNSTVTPTDKWKRYSVHWRVHSDVIPDTVTVRAQAGASVSVTQPKLEAGATMTPWTEKNADLVEKTALLATGIDIETRKVTVTADNFKVRNNQGQETMLVTEDGKLNTDIVESRVVKTYSLNGDAHIEMENGLMQVFGTNGICNIQFGVNGDGLAVLSYYDANGNWLYDLGPNQIDAGSQSGSSLTGTDYVSAEAFLGTTDFFGDKTYTLDGKDYTLKQVSLSTYDLSLFGVYPNGGVLSGGGCGYKPFENFKQSVKLYRYTAGRLQGTIVADSGRNLTQALAAQADGKYFTSQTISDGTQLLNLASGIHFLKTEMVASAPYPVVSLESYEYPAYCIAMTTFQNGKRTVARLYSLTERTVSPFAV